MIWILKVGTTKTLSFGPFGRPLWIAMATFILFKNLAQKNKNRNPAPTHWPIQTDLSWGWQPMSLLGHPNVSAVGTWA